MGWFSSEEVDKTVDTTGTVNNNVIVSDTVDVHNDHIVTILYVLAILKIIEMLYVIFKVYNKQNKKKYMKRGLSLRDLNNV